MELLIDLLTVQQPEDRRLAAQLIGTRLDVRASICREPSGTRLDVRAQRVVALATHSPL